jgi:hypothetical protein
VLERNPAAEPLNSVVDAQKEQLGRIHIQYDPPKNPEHQKIYQMLKDIGALETIQQRYPIRRRSCRLAYPQQRWRLAINHLFGLNYCAT